MTETHDNKPSAGNDTGFDRQEVDARFIGIFTIGTVVLLAAMIFAIQRYHDLNYNQQIYERVLSPVSEDLRNLRAREDQHLHSYEYISREKGTVRLTIDRAMTLLAEEYEAGQLKYPTTPYPVVVEEEAVATQ